MFLVIYIPVVPIEYQVPIGKGSGILLQIVTCQRNCFILQMKSFQVLITLQSKSNLRLSSVGKKANIILVHFISLIVTCYRFSTSQSL